ncbi:MAG: Hsp20/alpha crystallin family protein [Phycisphaerae bacterium]
MGSQMQGRQKDRFVTMARQMSRWVDQVLGPGGTRFCPGEAWAPAMNVCEYPHEYCIVVELAGVDTEELDLHIEDDALVISGIRAAPGAPPRGQMARLHMMEIDHGRFKRALPLPADADTEQIEATYRNGYLWIRLPKRS